MANKKILIGIFLLLTIFNLIIFLKRDNFQYLPFTNYKSLYNGKNADPTIWNNFNSQYPEYEKIETKRITDSLVNGYSATDKKAHIIGSYLNKRFKSQIGKPSNSSDVLSPLAQYYKLCSNENEKLWCGTIARLFSYFCYSQGIACRYIEIMQPGDHHVVNECYLPETKEWVLMDLTFNLLLIQNKNDDYLNLITFKDSLKKSPSFLTSNEFSTIDSNLSLSTIQGYYNNTYPLYYYHSLATDKVYSPSAKFVRYFLPISWYKIYAVQERSNLFFYIKDILFLLWLLTLSACFMPLKIVKND